VPSRPTRTVTFLFTDIQGSTRMIQDIGDRYADVLADYWRLLNEAFRQWGGVTVGTQGDGSLVAFSRASHAVAAAAAAQQALTRHSWPDDVSLRVRMGLHTGEAIHDAGNYVGLNVHRAARICAAAHGGQVLLSEVVRALAADDLPSDIGLRDLGPHRLKDLREPERLYQVMQSGLQTEFPPLNSLGPNNLPVQLTTFIGREGEIPKVKELLLRTRLLTLSGSGGLGKTRLAIQVAAELADQFLDGVWLVELAPLTDPSLVTQAVASLFSLREQPGSPLLTTLIEYLQSRHILLVLDNSEHLITACAQLADALLRACPRLHILATSRQTLGVTGETTWIVPPLSSPDPRGPFTLERLASVEAVRLFVDRAAAVLPTFSLIPENAAIVAEVCSRLDGIPLAVELAAARVRVLSVEQIRQRLHQRFQLLTGGSRTALPRHQTLRAAIEWSYALLSEKESAMFRRLSAFVGGCALEAVEAVCGADAVGRDEVLELIAQLVDKSLLLADVSGAEVRYRMLDTILEFGREKLVETSENVSVRRRHAEFFCGFAERAEPQLRGPGQAMWLARLETDHDNLRAALDWSLRDGSSEAGLGLAGALWRFWYVRGYYREGRRWLSQVLNQASTSSPAARAKVLGGAGHLAMNQGDYSTALALLEESLMVSRELGNKEGIALSLKSLGGLAWYQGDFARASELYNESLVLFRELEQLYNVGIVLNNLGVVATGQGAFAVAQSRLRESLALSRQLGDKQHIALAASNLGIVALRQGDYDAARSLFAESLALDRDLGDKRSISAELEEFGLLAAALRCPERAARLLGAAGALREAIGSPLTASTRAHLDYDRRLEDVRAALGSEAFAIRWSEGQAMTMEDVIQYALSDEVAQNLDRDVNATSDCERGSERWRSTCSSMPIRERHGRSRS
jgi:predicted ATPase/class 3 adenylate cyclase/Tfp pilus assembly protein PilF